MGVFKMKAKRVLSLLLVLAVLLGMTVQVLAAAPTDYLDKPNNWSKVAIEKAITNGLLFGSNGKIMPNDKLTRAQLAAIVNRAFGASAQASLAAFSDAAKGEWYYDDLAKAVSMGTFRGSNGKLNPEQAITREEAFAVLARAIKLTGTDDISALSRFSDAASISPWAKTELEELVVAGYVRGSAGKLNPRDNITRAEFAQIMDNLIKGYIQVAGTYASVPEGNIMINTPNTTLKDVTVKGDLIIGDGVGNGEVTLDNVTVTGRMVVRGGGVNSIKIMGASNLGRVIVARVDGQVRVVVSGGANVQVIIVDDGSDDVTVEGKIGAVEVKASGVTVTAKNAQIGTVTIAAASTKITVGIGSTVETIRLNAPNTTAEVSGTVKNVLVAKAALNSVVSTTGTAIIDKVKVEAAGTSVTGSGKVAEVDANANNVKVETPNTSVSAGNGTTGVTVGGKAVEPGKTATTPGSTGGKGGGSSSPVIVTGVSVTSAVYGVNPAIVRVGDILTANPTPAEATVAYRWSVLANADADTVAATVYATTYSYSVGPADLGKYIRVTINGIGSYAGTQSWTGTTAVMAPPAPPEPPAAPTFVSAKALNDGSSKVLLRFSKVISAVGLQADDFVVKTADNPTGIPDANIGITVIGLKNGDATTVELTLAASLQPANGVSVAYIAGTALAEDGGKLESFAAQPVVNQVIGTLQLSLSDDMTNITLGRVNMKVTGNGSAVRYPMKYLITSDASVSMPAPGATVYELTGANDLNLPDNSGTSGEVGGATASQYLVVYGYDNNPGGIIRWFGKIQVKPENIRSLTADIDLALTTPGVGIGNAIDVGGTTKTGSVNVVNGTASVVLLGTKTAAQTVTIGGTGAGYVTAGGTATAPSFTVDTASLAVAGGSQEFTLTVSEGGKADIVYLITIIVAAPGQAITGLGTIATVLQLGETITQTANTTELGTKSWSSSNLNVATVDPATGVVTAVTAGTTTISYTSDNGKANRVAVTVYNAASVANPDIATVQVLEADLTPTAFTAPLTGQTIVWESSDPSKATINAGSGLLHAVAAGNAVISYQVTEVATARIVAKGSNPITVLGAAENKLYISDYLNNIIIGCDPDGTNPATIVAQADSNPFSGPMAIAVSGQKIYWAGQDSQEIYSANLDGTQPNTILNTGTNNISGLVVDASTGRLYWADYTANKIQSAKLDGTDLQDVITNADNSTDSDKGPLALALSGQKLYWVGDTSVTIESANLDGSGRTTLVQTGAAAQSVNSLAIDTAAGKIYWNDYQNNRIMGANLTDGSAITAIITNADNGTDYQGVTAIAVKNGKVYWVSDSSGQISRANLDGSIEEIIYNPTTPVAINGILLK